MSYRKKHLKNKIHKIKPKKSILMRPIFWVVFTFVIIIVLFVYFLFFYPVLQVRNINISGNEEVKEKDLNNFVTGLINKKFIEFGQFKLTSGSIFLLDTDNVRQKILKEFPVIEDIIINKKLPQTLVIKVNERKQIGVFCNSATGSEQYYSIDQNGVIFELLSFLPENTPVVKQLMMNKEVFTGEEVVNKNIMNLISKIQKNLKENFKIDIKEALITNSLKLDIKTNENWQIYFDINSVSDIDIEIAKLNLLLGGEITPEVRKTLQYIDLRFKDRAYYK
jgi:cell division protein FtsQ